VHITGEHVLASDDLRCKFRDSIVHATTFVDRRQAVQCIAPESGPPPPPPLLCSLQFSKLSSKSLALSLSLSLTPSVTLTLPLPLPPPGAVKRTSRFP
jgi:hypothetical protein